MKKLFLFCLLLTSQSLLAQLKLAKVFTDYMVLQRQKPIPVWGWAKPNESVVLTLAGQKQTTQANQEGKWMVKFSPLEAGGPFTLEVQGGGEKIAFNDVLIGDVWLCSGQSNMEWTVKQADNFVNEKKNADYPKIRHFFVEHEVTTQPQTDLKSGEWKVCNSQNVGDFTAVGYFFAREVFQKTGVPIGLLHSSWGGSQVEGWISKEGMEMFDELKPYAQNLPKNWQEADMRLEESIKEKLLGNPKAVITLTDEQQYLKPGYDFSKWHTGSAIGQWDWQGIWAWRGNGFIAKTVEIPAEMIGEVTTLGLAESFSENQVYINGKLVFSGILKGIRKIVVPANTWKAGSNSLMIKMNKTIEPSWYGVGMMGNADDLYVSSEKQKVALGGNNWKLMPAFAEEHTFAHSSNNIGTYIYNGMIAPLLPFAIKGALWYQGETNAGRSYQYRKSFPLLINDWRRLWNDEFPFYFVQLSSFGSYQNSNQGSGWAELREAQTMTLSLPKTGMAVTTDIGNPKDIHPTNKQDVGKRLAAEALKNTYGLNIVSAGPMYASVNFEKGKATISFKNVGGGLMIKDKFGYLKGFEIAGEDKVFYYAKAEIQGDKVLVYHPKGAKPASVRYAWADAPEDANLFNQEGFPACPFRTDQWKGVTEGVKFK
ncbi:MAG: sialate O-acetylesterase [Flectobacillus sp.]|uniref:sialate O-acetylesterase n=1 Tax=Flectobacillus sp. TaxID=50419 RepID=UPI003B9DB7B5